MRHRDMKGADAVAKMATNQGISLEEAAQSFVGTVKMGMEKHGGKTKIFRFRYDFGSVYFNHTDCNPQAHTGHYRRGVERRG